MLGVVQHPQEEEKRSKSAGTMSIQTVTEPGQPKPVAVALIQKRKSKRKSVHMVTDKEAAGPSHPAEEMELEVITCSLSLGELWREFTHQANKPILTWLLRTWDTAGNDTMVDGSEARQLGSLSQDVIDQRIRRTQETQPLAATADKRKGQVPV